MPRVNDAGEGEGVRAVVLALRILELLAARREPVGVTQLAQALGTTKSRIHRHLQTLVQQGYVLYGAASERYAIGARAITLAQAAGENFTLAEIAHGAIRKLRDELGHACAASRVEREGVRVIVALPGTSAVELGVKPGSLLPYHATAQGKLALAYGDAGIRAAVLGAPLDRATPQTIVTPAAMARELERIRARGWADAPNQTVVGLNTLAAPIFGPGRALIGTIGMIDFIQFIPDPPAPAQVERVLSAAAEISAAVGGWPG